jgi:hypothetical protein
VDDKDDKKEQEPFDWKAFDDYYCYDFDEFKGLMQKTTENLQKMTEAQKRMRWQFGDPPIYEEFVKAMDDARLGWMSSNC